MHRDADGLIQGVRSQGCEHPSSGRTPARGGAVLPHHSPEGSGRTGGVHVALVSGFLHEEVGGRGAGRRSRGRVMIPGLGVGTPLRAQLYTHQRSTWTACHRLSHGQRYAGAVTGCLITPVLFKWLNRIQENWHTGFRKGFRLRHSLKRGILVTLV
jgi:hypothetical protein